MIKLYCRYNIQITKLCITFTNKNYLNNINLLIAILFFQINTKMKTNQKYNTNITLYNLQCRLNLK